MVYTHHRLIQKWQKCPLASPPFILPEDRSEFQSQHLSIYHSFNAYVASSTFGQRNEKTLHVGLLPIPYIGNLQKASVFILMLNPGLSPGDYFAEYRNESFRKVLVRNLRQENGTDEFPFFSLDPHFAWHPGFEYWQGKFDNIAQVLMEKEKISYREALKRLSQNVACLELAPYHSKSFGAGKLLNRLTSVKVMLEYVHDILISKALSKDATIIVTRSVQNWNLPKHKNIVVYKGGETRSAHLTLKSSGGKAIAMHLGL